MYRTASSAKVRCTALERLAGDEREVVRLMGLERLPREKRTTSLIAPRHYRRRARLVQACHVDGASQRSRSDPPQ